MVQVCIDVKGWESERMYGFITGITDNDDISFCPKCGSEITEFISDGTAICHECEYHFGVVECED